MINVNLTKYLIGTLALSLLTSPLTVSAQLSKVPTISNSVPMMQEVEALVMPESYPQEIIDYYASNIDARSYIVLDSQTNRVLAQQGATTRYPIASMSKVLVAYLAYQAIADGRLKMQDKITVPQAIEDHFSFNPEMSAMGLTAGSEYTVKELIYGIMLASGNDATSTLMWHLYGSEQEGVKAIRDLLTSWGITNFEFYTTSGIPNLYIPEEYWIEGSNASNENQMTAADVAFVAQKTITDFPEILTVTSAESFVCQEGTDHEITLFNHNELLPGRSYGREGITGLKSGVTDAAGKNFVATGKENGRDIIVVVMGLFDTAELIMSSYWEIEILLNKLAEFPDLYQDESLPTYTVEIPLLVEDETSENINMENISLSDEQEALLVEQGITGENKRDTPITNFFKSIFNFFD